MDERQKQHLIDVYAKKWPKYGKMLQALIESIAKNDVELFVKSFTYFDFENYINEPEDRWGRNAITELHSLFSNLIGEFFSNDIINDRIKKLICTSIDNYNCDHNIFFFLISADYSFNRHLLYTIKLLNKIKTIDRYYVIIMSNKTIFRCYMFYRGLDNSKTVLNEQITIINLLKEKSTLELTNLFINTFIESESDSEYGTCHKLDNYNYITNLYDDPMFDRKKNIDVYIDCIIRMIDMRDFLIKNDNCELDDKCINLIIRIISDTKLSLDEMHRIICYLDQFGDYHDKVEMSNIKTIAIQQYKQYLENKKKRNLWQKIISSLNKKLKDELHEKELEDKINKEIEKLITWLY